MQQKININKYLLLLLFVNPFFLLGQSDRIKQLESNLPNQQGLQYVFDAITLSDWNREEGFYKAAVVAGEKAEKRAIELNNRIYEAKALTTTSRSLILLKDYRKANNSLKKSQKLLKKDEERSIQLENILNLIQVAKLRKKSKDIKKHEQALAIFKGEMTAEEYAEADESRGFNLFGKKKRMIEAKLDETEKEKEALAEKLEEVKTEKEELVEENEQLDVVTESLNEILSYRQDEIKSMSEDKAKTELLLAKKQHLVDSLNFASVLDSFAMAQQEFLMEQQNMALVESEAKIEIQKSQRNLLIAIASIFVILAVGLYSSFVGMKKHKEILEIKNEIIKEQKQRSEELLLNILPLSIANELKKSGSAKTQLYEKATVLFIDFIGFSKIAAQLSSEQLVQNLDYCFKAFDQIIKKYNLEKIKTIGDAYMCAGGLPTPDPEHPKNVIKAALEIQDFLAEWNLEKKRKKEPIFEARVGIHTGPVIAGVVGDIKFAYDIWGDTVNVASRMETNSESGKVNISGTTYGLVKDAFKCTHRGKVLAKNMGMVDMYFVEN